jgi:hypothetical protein
MKTASSTATSASATASTSHHIPKESSYFSRPLAPRNLLIFTGSFLLTCQVVDYYLFPHRAPTINRILQNLSYYASFTNTPSNPHPHQHLLHAQQIQQERAALQPLTISPTTSSALSVASYCHLQHMALLQCLQRSIDQHECADLLKWYKECQHDVRHALKQQQNVDRNIKST